MASQTVGRHSLPRRERVFLRSRSVCRLLLSYTDACWRETSTGKVQALLILMMRLDAALSARIKAMTNEMFVPRKMFVRDLMFSCYNGYVKNLYLFFYYIIRFLVNLTFYYIVFL